MPQPFDWRSVPRLVWLYEHDPEYRDHFDAIDGKAAPPPEIDSAAMARSMAESKAIRACPYFTRSGLCGCKFGRCDFPWRRTATTKEECLACLTAQGAHE